MKVFYFLLCFTAFSPVLYGGREGGGDKTKCFTDVTTGAVASL
jgi:hypothetical protein